MKYLENSDHCCECTESLSFTHKMVHAVLFFELYIIFKRSVPWENGQYAHHLPIWLFWDLLTGHQTIPRYESSWSTNTKSK